MFSEKYDIPPKHLMLILICNSNKFAWQQQFYKLKHALLEKYGRADGYDIQNIKRECWSCIKGTHTTYNGFKELCYKCDGTGIYSERTQVLRRYKLNDHLFHIPVEWDTSNPLQAKNKIDGLVKHTPVKGNPMLAYGLLLWIYDRNEFFLFAGRYGSMLKTRALHKWKMIIHKSNNTIEGWCRYWGLTPAETEDDLPF